MGCFFSPNASENAPGHAFKNGARRVRGWEIPIFIVFRGFGRAAVSAPGLSNMQRCPGSRCWKWGIFQQKIQTMTLPPTPSVETGLGFTLVRRGRTCPELRGEWVFRVGGSKKSMKRPKTRDLKKWPNIFVVARPSSFCAFFWCAWLSPKTGFWNSRNFRWNHCKRSAKWSVLENPFCTLGFEIGHLTSASNIVPIYFCFDWHFLSHWPWSRLGHLFYLSCLFPFLSFWLKVKEAEEGREEKGKKEEKEKKKKEKRRTTQKKKEESKKKKEE